MEVHRMRRWIAVAVVALCFLAVSTAQEQPEVSARSVVTRVVPVYPELARKWSFEGVVKLRVTVAPDGAVKSSEVVGGSPLLIKSAQDAVARWKWAPAPHETKEVVELKFRPQ
jgi:TonB family protein